jgi:hypothetical protein
MLIPLLPVSVSAPEVTAAAVCGDVYIACSAPPRELVLAASANGGGAACGPFAVGALGEDAAALEQRPIELTRSAGQPIGHKLLWLHCFLEQEIRSDGSIWSDIALGWRHQRGI